MITVKTVLMVEMKVKHEDTAIEELEEKLDAFREAVLPSENYGLTIWRAGRTDLEEMAQQGCLLPNPGVLTVARKKAK